MKRCLINTPGGVLTIWVFAKGTFGSVKTIDSCPVARPTTFCQDLWRLIKDSFK